MADVWPACRLRDVAAVRVSNVDKKTFAAETPIRLCNYMDVYANDYVTDAIEFMPASASAAEVDRFGLLAGDVVITKDSETPDDIGVPTVIVEHIEGLVCGYHLALIRPDQGRIHPVYLAKQLGSSSSVKYFAVHASGSTRFGLPIGAIENLPVPLPSLPEQTEIAEVLSTVDRAIEQTEALIAKQQRIKTGLMQDLLTRGIDENGTLRSEDTHEFKDSPAGRIPACWQSVSIGECCEVLDRYRVPINAEERADRPGNVPYYGANGRQGYIDDYIFDEPLILIAEDGGRFDEFATRPIAYRIYGQSWVNNHAHVLRTREGAHQDYVFYALEHKDIQPFIVGGTRAKLNQVALRSILIAIPQDEAEQVAIADHLESTDTSVGKSRRTLAKLRRLKSGLMQDLLTGRRRVTALLEQPEPMTA